MLGQGALPLKILLSDPRQLDNPGVWALVNEQDKRVVVTPSPKLLFSVLDRLRRFSYQDHHQHSDLIQDYLQGKLSVVLLEAMGDFHPVLGAVLKSGYVSSFESQGWRVYEAKAQRIIPYVVPVPEHGVVYVVLRPKKGTLDLEKHLVVGVFKDGHRARAWADQYYPEWRRGKAVERVVVASNPTTRRFFVEQQDS